MSGQTFATLIDEDNDRCYLGGGFDYIGPSGEKHGAELSTATGEVSEARDRPDGEVLAAVDDGSGGWFIGGTFANIGPHSMLNLAHIDQNGDVIGSFDMPVTASNNAPVVYALEISENHKELYVGGAFDGIGGVGRLNLAVIDVSVDPPQVMASDLDVRAPVRSMDRFGSDLYVGGELFTSVGPVQGFSRLAKIHFDEGWGTVVSTWKPQTSGNNFDRVMKIIAQENFVYICGDFTAAGSNGSPQLSSLGRIARIESSTGLLDTSWAPNPDSRVHSMAICTIGGHEQLFMGGAFTALGGGTYTGFDGLAQLTLPGLGPVLSLGVHTSWQPQFTSGRLNHNAFTDADVMGLEAIGDEHPNGPRLFVSGLFQVVNRELRYRLCAFDLNHKLPELDEGWRADADNQVWSLFIDEAGDHLYAGGTYRSIGGVPSVGVAAIQLSTGEAVPDWGTHIFYEDGSGMRSQGEVKALALDRVADQLYIGGVFNNTAAGACSNAGRLDAATGGLDPTWMPDPGGSSSVGVNALALNSDGSTIYLGGDFTHVQGVTSPYLVAVNNTDGDAFPGWLYPTPNAVVHALLFDQQLYIGGEFTGLGGSLDKLARCSAIGSVDPYWDPGTSDIFAMAKDEGRDAIIAGGSDNVYLLDAATADLEMFSSTMAPVTAVCWSNGVIYAGGEDFLHAISSCGEVGTWAPTPVRSGSNGKIFALAAGERYLAAGGLFNEIDAQEKFCFSGYHLPPIILPRIKVLLSGAYDISTHLMKDALRTDHYLPENEPFTALGFSVDPCAGQLKATLTDIGLTGNNVIVDWVLIELRHPTSPSTILHSEPALVQRDGDVVATNGSPFTIQADLGNYKVAVRHRNHLGTMTSSVVTFGSTPVSIDFTDPGTSTYGTNGQRTVDGKHMLWAGNAVVDNILKYTGIDNDRDQMLLALGGNPNAILAGYHSEDCNLDGVVKYTGTDNDRDLLLLNLDPLVPTFTRSEQLP